ncbi:MAG: rhomboid family intramembrane serine protease [Gemmatimonadetes bacterium]|nr:rhomboid family intramembrane serine protease [Gemmatimonadota bacterium]
MRYSQQTPAFGNVSARLNVTPWVKRLLIANAVVYLITRAVGQDPVFDLFAFSPDRIWTRPWGILTYMFLHAGFWHLLMNMLFIFFFGPPLESRWGSAVFIKFYLICGLGGVLLCFAVSN